MKLNRRSKILTAAYFILYSMAKRKLDAYLHMAVFCLGKVLEDDTTRCTTSTGEVQPQPTNQRPSCNTELNPERKESPAGSQESGSFDVSFKAQTDSNKGTVQQREEQGNYSVSTGRRRVQQVSEPAGYGVENVQR